MSHESAAGLCSACLHSKEIVSDRGSLFILCQRALGDSAWAKYPHLPVLSCHGFEPSRPPMNHRLQLRVKSITRETAAIRTYDLRALDGATLPAFTAGAH